MTMTARLEKLLPDVLDVFKRFPIAGGIAVVLCIYMNALGFEGSFNWDWDAALSASAAFLAAGAGHLFAESRKFSRLGNTVIAAAMGVVGFALMFFYSTFQPAELFMFPGLILLLMVAGFLHQHASQGAVWLFNMRLSLAIILAIVIALVFGLGLAAIVAGLNFLLNVDLGQNAYQHIWIVAVCLVGPIYGLSLVPTNLAEEINIADHKGNLIERGVSMLVNYVMVPLVIVYAVILHAYALKIIINGALPKGEIGIIVSLFAIGGTATWLIGWPWREQGTWLLRWFMRGWFWLIPVPAVLLSIAIWRRVSDYGITTDRYGVALIAIWTALVFLYLVFRRNKADMRLIIGSAAALLLAASFGPQGAYSITASSQITRLQNLLQSNSVLKDGKVVGSLSSASSAIRQDAYSMIHAIKGSRGLNRIRLWFDPSVKLPEDDDRNGTWALADLIQVNLGLADPYTENDAVAFNPQMPLDLKLPAGVRLLGPLIVHDEPTKTFAFSNDVMLTFDRSEIKIRSGAKEWRTSLPDLVSKLHAQQKSDLTKTAPQIVPLEGGASLWITQAYGVNGKTPSIASMTVLIILPQP